MMVVVSTNNCDQALTSAWSKFKPHKIQMQAWRCEERFVAIAAGRGSGKTELAKRRLVRCLAVPKPWHDPRYFYGAPTEAQAKRIAWLALRALIPSEWIEKDGISASDLTIRTRFGSLLKVVGLDRPERIEGEQWDGGILDESCDLKPGVFDRSIVPMLTHRFGWCWRIGVPKRQGPSAAEFRNFFENAATGLVKQTAAFTWPSSDILSVEQLVFAKTHLDIRDYLEQFDAKFQTAGGGVFHAFDRELHVRPCSYDSSKVLIIGSDFNVDPMAWIIGHRYENTLEWIDEIWIRDTNTPATLKVLLDRYSNHKGGFAFYGDASGRARKSSATESDYHCILNDKDLKQRGRLVTYPSTNPSVEDRYSACNLRLRNADGECRMFVDPRCKHLIVDLEACHYKPGTRESAKGGDLSHISDAMGYVVCSIFPIQSDFDFGIQPIGIVQG